MPASERKQHLQRIEVLFWQRVTDDVALGVLLEAGLFRQMLLEEAGAEAERLCRAYGDLTVPVAQQSKELKQRLEAHMRASLGGNRG